MHMLYFEQDLVIMVIFSELRLYLDKIGDADLLNCVQALMQPSRRWTSLYTCSCFCAKLVMQLFLRTCNFWFMSCLLLKTCHATFLVCEQPSLKSRFVSFIAKQNPLEGETTKFSFCVKLFFSSALRGHRLLCQHLLLKINMDFIGTLWQDLYLKWSDETKAKLSSLEIWNI